MDLLLYILALLPLVQAWTFQYTDSFNETTTLHETRSLGCTGIGLAGGKEFSWDPEGRQPCLYLFPDPECQDIPGYYCGSAKKLAEKTFWGIEVEILGETASASSASTVMRTLATSTSSSTSSSIPSTSSSSSSTSSSTSSNSSSGSSLSGGAIAGIVVGAVGALLIVAAVFFFFGRRQKQKAILANQQDTPKGPDGPDTTGHAEADALTSSNGISEKPTGSYPTGVGPAPGSQVFELAGQNRPAELANNPVHELDTRN